MVGEGNRGQAARIMTQLELFSLMKKMGIAPEEATGETAGQETVVLPVRLCQDESGFLAALQQEGAANFLPVYGSEGTFGFWSFSMRIQFVFLIRKIPKRIQFFCGNFLNVRISPNILMIPRPLLCCPRTARDFLPWRGDGYPAGGLFAESCFL